MIEKEYSEKIRPILDCYDRIREILGEIQIGIPQICVVGYQSSGKSSVLESISGIKLPRGEDIVTRCPIQLRLRRDKNDEYARIKMSDEDDSKYIKVELLKLEEIIKDYQKKIIQESTNKVTEKGFIIEVHSKNAPDLTLFDLPGLTYEEDKVEELTQKLVKKYTEGEETIILLVIAANGEITASQGISLIRKQSNYMNRTIPVYTKIDLVIKDGEKNLVEKLSGNKLNLKYTPFLVINRNQDEIDKNVEISHILQKEKEFFSNYEIFKEIKKDRKGIKSLVNKLLQLQKEKLINSKKIIKEKINNELNKVNKEIKELPPRCETQKEKLEILFERCSEFQKLFNFRCQGDSKKKV